MDSDKMDPSHLKELALRVGQGDAAEYKFGPFPIPQKEVFYSSSLCYATVNLKPVVPGHVLVIPKRVVERLHQLTAEETADLLRSAQLVGALLERRHGRRALTVAIQDGRDAGQTVPHLHLHVMPRSPTDFERNDDVYEALDSTSMQRASRAPDSEDTRKERTHEDMADEAADLRAFAKKLIDGDA